MFVIRDILYIFPHTPVYFLIIEIKTRNRVPVVYITGITRKAENPYLEKNGREKNSGHRIIKKAKSNR